MLVSVVALVFAVTGPLPDLLSVVRAFRRRAPGVQLEDLPGEEPRSATDRLRQIDELHAANVITDSERAEQRARVLGEL